MVQLSTGKYWKKVVEMAVQVLSICTCIEALFPDKGFALVFEL